MQLEHRLIRDADHGAAMPAPDDGRSPFGPDDTGHQPDGVHRTPPARAGAPAGRGARSLNP